MGHDNAYVYRCATASMQSFILPGVGWLKDKYYELCICSPRPEQEEAREKGLKTIA